MPITLQCDCGKSLRVKDEFAGKQARCPACRAVLDVPKAGSPEAETAEADDLSRPGPPTMASAYGVGSPDTEDKTLPPSRRKPARRREDEDEEEEDEDRPARRRSRRRSYDDAGGSRPRPNVVGLVVGLLFLLLGIGILFLGVRGRSFGGAIGLVVAGVIVMARAAAGEE